MTGRRTSAVAPQPGTAPVVLAARSNGDDAFAPGRTDVVPLNFRTDGSWVWPGAVAYYLLAGVEVFDGKSIVEICSQHIHQRPEPLSAPRSAGRSG